MILNFPTRYPLKYLNFGVKIQSVGPESVLAPRSNYFPFFKSAFLSQCVSTQRPKGLESKDDWLLVFEVACATIGTSILKFVCASRMP